MPKKPTTADAQIILQLYDFRREAEMRKARNWFNGQFWPKKWTIFSQLRVISVSRKTHGFVRWSHIGT